MRRGSVTTYVDDGRRHSAGMVTPEYRGSSSNSNHNTRQEFTVNDIDYERTGGCFVSYRKIAFAFVFCLAFVIAAAFIGVYIGSPPDKSAQDALAILSKNEEAPNKYVFSQSINPTHYEIELLPIPEIGTEKIKIRGHVIIDFQQTTTIGSNQLVLSSKNLTFTNYRLVVHDKDKNATSASEVRNSSRRRKRDMEEAENESTTAPATTIDLVTTTIPVVTTFAISLNDSITIAPTSTPNETEKVAASATNAGPSIVKVRIIDETEVKINSNKTDEAGGVHVIFLEKPLKFGNYSLELNYEATVDDRVLIMKNITKNNVNKLLLVSKLKPAGAPRLFPTFDDAKLKASFALTVLHPPELKALSNMPLINSTDSKKISENGENLIADTFAETQRMSAYNLAFAAGNIESLGEVTIEETPLVRKHVIGYWGDIDHKSQEFYLRDKILPIVTAYTELFQGVARPTENLNLVALPVDFDGLSTPGLIIVKESLFYAAASSPSFMKARALLCLTGLFGQQWLGGLSDAKNWTDAWFIEGSVLYLKHALIDKIDPKLVVTKNFLIDIQLKSMENDGYFVSKALDSKVDRIYIEAFDLLDSYRKGGCLISMLHNVLKENIFRRGFVEFLRQWNHSSADSNTFLNLLVGNSTIDGESTSWTEFFDSWTRKSSYPLVNITWNSENNTIVARQGKFNFDELWKEEKHSGNVGLWWVPLTCVTSEGNWSDPTFVWMKGKEEVTFKVPGYTGNGSWIVCNVNMTGYYRVNYEEANWRSIMDVLKTKHTDFPVSMRTAFIDDALSLAHQGSLTYESAFDLISYLGPSEREYEPWAAFAKHASQLDFVLFESTAYPYYQEYMQKFVSMLFDDMEAKIDEGSSLAMLAVRLACAYEYKKCTAWGRNKWNDLLTSSKENTLMKHVRQTVYCTGARIGGPDELSNLMKKIDTEDDEVERRSLLSALGCFQSPWILKKVLIEILDTRMFTSEDVRIILKTYLKNPAAAKVAGRFVQEQWKRIYQKFSESYWTLKVFVEASAKLLFTEIDLNEFSDFRDKNIDSLKGLGQWVAFNEIKASSWITRLKESAETIQTWFKSHTNSTE